MTRLERIEKEVSELTRAELDSFRGWFENFDAARWDEQLAHDAATGTLDDLAEQALADHRAGRTEII
jgi:hypothetical protein